MPHIHLVDSDSTALTATAALLERARYHVSQSNGGRDALRTVFGSLPDLVILEAELPDQDGFEVLRRIRRSSDIPVIFYSWRARTEDRILGLRLGADDYVPKDIPSAELAARVGAVLRRCERARRPPTERLNCGAWTLDPAGQICVAADRPAVELTPREVHLLSFLMKRSGQVCTTGQIVHHVWGYTARQSRSIVATSVWRLRAKLEHDADQPRHILTVRNVGYTFVP
ncbi:MAG: response regulator transcription factor [Chloroflexi bacterium]|nr:response regulator transcription factor [Chloroflexota bacterium]